MAIRKEQGPLMYIYQPFSRTPSNYNMQEVFKNKKNMDDVPEFDQKPKVEERVPVQVTSSEDNTLETTTSSKKVKPHSSMNRVKPFKEMNVSEQLDYLIHYPKVLPMVPCVFYTDKESYQGYLIGYENDEAIIQFHNEKTKTLCVDEIKSIMMIGLKK
ncbi:CotO family spore coat protein [Neobacillus sp. LXY-1]|uniref:CotO family spore coat protein n=1 Tax=Neobacillus sp. LXY-1 TaxID=3379133 RepID=UPI003EE328C3